MDYERLDFSATFKGAYANFFEMELSPNEEVIPSASAEYLDEERYLLSTYNVSAIDLSEPAVLKIFNTDKPDQYAVYNVDFSTYGNNNGPTMASFLFAVR